MSRIFAAFLVVLTASFVSLPLSASASTASVPRVAAPSGEDDPIDLDLDDLCALLAGTDAEQDTDEAAATSRSTNDPDEPTDDPDEDDPVDGEDPANTADAIDCDDEIADEDEDYSTAAAGPDRTVTLAGILKKGSLFTGPVSMPGPGTIKQEVWIDAPGGPRGVKASAAAKKRTVGKPKGKLLGGKLTRTVDKAGVVNMTVRLNAAARKTLRKSQKAVRITVKTTTRVRGGKARKRTTTMVVPVR